MSKRYNIYRCMNEITDYIDEHLDEKIEYELLAKKMGVNALMMKKIFEVLSGISLTEYIRKRRLSVAGVDLLKSNALIIDIAMKYEYENATSFSRAFTNFHGIKPSQVTKLSKLKNFPKLTFAENLSLTEECSYEVVELEELNLYGISVETNNDNIHIEAPEHFEKTDSKYRDKYGPIQYACVSYTDGDREYCQKYTVLYEKEIPGSEKICIPASSWLLFRIGTQEPKDIQEASNRFYSEFLPSCRFNFKALPELEHYHDGVTDFLVPII